LATLPGVTDPAPAARTCQWCGTVGGASTTTCPGCGAALGERDDLGGLVIPGVTSVDPALQAYDAQPLRLTRPSPSQGMAGGAVLAAAAGGPVGLAALGGLAAVAAVEYLGAGSSSAARRATIESLGTPSEAARLMVEKLNARGPTGDSRADPAADPAGGAASPSGEGATGATSEGTAGP
jgi:hypothetical protein